MDTLRFKKIDSLNLDEVKAEFLFFMAHAERMDWEVSNETLAYMNKLDSVIKALS
jgi:hypothetical protein